MIVWFLAKNISYMVMDEMRASREQQLSYTYLENLARDIENMHGRSGR